MPRSRSPFLQSLEAAFCVLPSSVFRFLAQGAMAISAHTQVACSEDTYENDRDKLRQFIHRET